MIILKAHLRESGKPITLYLSTNFSVTTVDGAARISDGVNNNGGWSNNGGWLLKESQSDIEFAIEQWLAKFWEARQ